jgi:hypothetical protein
LVTPIDKTIVTTAAKPSGIAATASEDLTYYAVFEAVSKIYTVTFVGANGETLETVEVYYGETPACSKTPVKESDVYYHYTFAGWDNEIVPAIGNTTYVAQFDRTLREYKVVWRM